MHVYVCMFMIVLGLFGWPYKKIYKLLVTVYSFVLAGVWGVCVGFVNTF